MKPRIGKFGLPAARGNGASQCSRSIDATEVERRELELRKRVAAQLEGMGGELALQANHVRGRAAEEAAD